MNYYNKTFSFAEKCCVSIGQTYKKSLRTDKNYLAEAERNRLSQAFYFLLWNKERMKRNTTAPTTAVTISQSSPDP